jgi:hypothetical protein
MWEIHYYETLTPAYYSTSVDLNCHDMEDNTSDITLLKHRHLWDSSLEKYWSLYVSQS